MKTSTYHAWDRALDGSLSATLLGYLAEGLSAEEIGYRLRSDHDIKVSRSTVIRWLTIARQEGNASEAAS